jgi:hypothetical protein
MMYRRTGRPKGLDLSIRYPIGRSLKAFPSLPKARRRYYPAKRDAWGTVHGARCSTTADLVDPARDIRQVVMTHLHHDHTGGLEHFPHTEILASGECLSAARRDVAGRVIDELSSLTKESRVIVFSSAATNESSPRKSVIWSWIGAPWLPLTAKVWKWFRDGVRRGRRARASRARGLQTIR